MSPKKKMPCLTEGENRDLRKQIGCMNGVFQLFDRRHFLTGRRITHKRLLPDAQHQLDPLYATNTLSEKKQEVHKDKTRISAESSQPSYSSPSCSSALSSLYPNKTVQPEKNSLRQNIFPENSNQIKARKDQKPSLTEERLSLDLRDIVKDSMYREARGLSIKSRANDERRGHAMKHIDSPRPMYQSKSGKPKATGYNGPSRVPDKFGEGTKNEKLVFHRYSCDGRESRETFKSQMKLKELPRLSLDSKASVMKCSAIDSRSNFPSCNLQKENDKSSQVPQFNQDRRNHKRSSSVVAKLMGLDNCLDTVSTDERSSSAINPCSSPTPEKDEENQVTCSPRLSHNKTASPSQQLHNVVSIRKPCTRFSMEPAPSRQQRVSAHNRTVPNDKPHTSSSVYGEIEKRITHLEFKKSGKDLRALKHILEAMQKTRAQLVSPAGESAEFTLQRRCSLGNNFTEQSARLLMWNTSKSKHQVPAIRRPCPPKHLGSPIVIIRPGKRMEKVKNPSSTVIPTMEMMHLQRIQTSREKAKDLTPRNNTKNPSWHLHSTNKMTRNPEPDRTLQRSQRIKVRKCNTSGRNFAEVSLRLHPTTPSSDSGRVERHPTKKLVGKGLQNRKPKVKTNTLRSSCDHLSELCNDTKNSSYLGDTASTKSKNSNISLVSQMETDFIHLVNPVNTDVGKKQNSVSGAHMLAVELAATAMEQPSPVSVLDPTIYVEDSPSPVRKILTAFQDESMVPDEAEWHRENSIYSTECTTHDHGYDYNQRLHYLKDLGHELGFFCAEHDVTAANHKRSPSLTPYHRYINKILLISGPLKDTSFISTFDQLLEQTENVVEGANKELVWKKDGNKLNEKSERRIVFDVVNEILFRRTTSSRLLIAVRKGISMQGVLKEVYLEIDRLQALSYCSHDDEDDGSMRLLTEDMTYQSEDWVNCSGEIPALVLDIERLVFKELINEVVMGEIYLPQRHCRQLFTK